MARDLKRVPTVSVGPQTGARLLRSPRHNFNVVFAPYDIQPVVAAPVQAGDSIKSIRFESRILTNPLLNQVTGWWAEMYFFYVRFSNLYEADDAKRMIVTPDDALTGLDTTSAAWTYHAGSGPNWVRMAMKPIIETYFRKEGEAWDLADAVINSVPVAGRVGRTWVDTVDLTSNLPAVPDDYTDRWTVYQTLRKQKLVTMDFPEYLRSQGVAVPDQLREPTAEKRRPELIRFIRQFTYPTNTVNPDPAVGGQVTAASWVVSERADKRIFCDEPGFIVGCVVVRPKVYLSNQRQTGLAYLDDSRSWVPQLLEDAPQESLDNRVSSNPGTTQTAGSLTTSQNYSLDLQSIFVLGDQFVRGSNAPVATLPDATDFQKAYPLETDIQNLFVDDADDVMADGTCTLSITGRQALSTIT